jgi:DNA/RNA endonuclease YhcR with UshA esterase domain
MSTCPSCGRYVGPQAACPYCGAHLTGRLSIRAVKVTAIALATVGLSSAVKVSLRDVGPAAQGEIVVFIWRNVLDRIADIAGVGTEGSRVRVTGTVQTYRSNLEIVPALPNDVTVLEIP